MESVETRYRLPHSQELPGQEVPTSYHSTTSISQLEEEVDQEIACQEENILSKVPAHNSEIKGPQRLQVPG